MCASIEASTTATSTSLCTTSSTVVTSSAVPVIARLARLEVDLHPEAVGDVAQHRAEALDRIAGGREGDAATEADPLHPVEDRSVALGDQVDRRRERVEVLVLAVEVEHETAEVGGDLAQLGVVGDAETRMLARRVGEVEGRVADAGVDAQRRPAGHRPRHGAAAAAPPS